MPEPFLERLTRFTPAAGRLDRDSLIFAAGRSSARPNRAWVALASTLAVSQVLSLALLLPGSILFTRSSRRVAERPQPALTPAPRIADLSPIHSSAPGDAWVARRTLIDADGKDQATPLEDLIDSGPPLRASGSLPSAILN